MLEIAIVDDEIGSRQLLARYLLRYSKERGERFVVKNYESGIAFLEAYSTDTDIVFLDIEMPGISGMETAHGLRRMDEDICIIFVTNLARYALNGYEVNALDFIVKPVQYASFVHKMDHVLRLFARRKAAKSILLHCDGIMRKLDVSEILYVETVNSYLVYHTLAGELRTRGALKNVEKELGEDGFSRCNSCYLVNMRYVTNVRGDCVMVGEVELKMSRNRKKSLLYYLYSLFGVLVVLFLQYGLFEKAVLQREKDVVEQLLAMESRQHKLSEETVALIELKCHDLKHQLAVLRQSGGADLAVVEDFQQTVDTYDSIIETGNSALNIILTEKSFLCERYGITLSCLVDGHLFDFMASSDLCSLFGNALDNAVEGVQHEAPENRFISVKSGRQGRLICLHIENYCGRALRFEDGLPVTTKEQTGFHGFGVKSIRFLAEKYGGHADMRLENTRFLLTIVIPHPDEQ